MPWAAWKTPQEAAAIATAKEARRRARSRSQWGYLGDQHAHPAPRRPVRSTRKRDPVYMELELAEPTVAARAKRPSAPPPLECPICLEHLDDASPALACGHRYHAACVQGLVATAWAEGARRTRGRGTAVPCPLCRGQSYVQ